MQSCIPLILLFLPHSPRLEIWICKWRCVQEERFKRWRRILVRKMTDFMIEHFCFSFFNLADTLWSTLLNKFFHLVDTFMIETFWSTHFDRHFRLNIFNLEDTIFIFFLSPFGVRNFHLIFIFWFFRYVLSYCIKRGSIVSLHLFVDLLIWKCPSSSTPSKLKTVGNLLK